MFTQKYDFVLNITRGVCVKVKSQGTLYSFTGDEDYCVPCDTSVKHKHFALY